MFLLPTNLSENDTQYRVSFLMSLTLVGIALFILGGMGLGYYVADWLGLCLVFVISFGFTLIFIGQTNTIMYHLAYHQSQLILNKSDGLDDYIP